MYNADAKHFDMEVVKASRGGSVVVIFHGPNCRPCATLKPILEAITAEWGVTFVGVDASLNRALVQQFTLRMVPTVMVFQNGEAVGTRLGSATEAEMRSWLAAAGVPPKVAL